MNRTWRLTINKAGLALLGVLGLFCACTSRRGTEPVPERYYLYAALQGSPSGQIAIVDCDADSVVDSITYDFAPDLFAYVSADGQYLAAHEWGRPPMIWDLTSKSALGRLPGRMVSVLLMPERGLVLGQSKDSVQVISLPDLRVLDVWYNGILFLKALPGSENLIGMMPYFPGSTSHPRKLVIFDLAEKRVVDSAFGYDSELAGLSIRSFSLSPDGRRVYIVGAHSDYGPTLAGWDFGARQILFWHSFPCFGIGFCRVSLDNREVWLTAPGDPSPMYPRGPGWILVYDASSGAILDTIHTLGVDPRQPDEPLYVQDIRFHPDGEKVYVCGSGGSIFQPSGPILVIDRKTHQIANLIFDKSMELIESIDLGPAP